jgi:hypothetical protein
MYPEPRPAAVASLVCPACGAVNPPSAVVCGRCQYRMMGGAPPPPAYPPAPRAPLPSATPHWMPPPGPVPLTPTHHGHEGLLWRSLAVVGLLLAVVLVLAAIVYFVPRPFDLIVEAGSCGPATVQLPLSSGAAVSFSWNSTGNHTLPFSVIAPGGGAIYSANATRGATQFRAGTTGLYAFTATSCSHQEVFVIGSYSIA